MAPKGKKPIGIRYHLQNPCLGVYDYSDTSMILPPALAEALNARRKDGIAVCRGGSAKRNSSAAMDLSVVGMIDTEGEFD